MTIDQRYFLPVISLLLVIAGSAAHSAAEAADSVKLSLLSAGSTNDDVKGFLEFAPAFDPSAPGYDADKEAVIRSTCRAPDGAEESIGAILFSLFVEPAIDFIQKSIEKKLEKEGKQYTGSYASTVTVPFYKSGGDAPTLRWSCFRFTRVADGKLALDFVGQFRLVDDGDAVQVRSLRLYYAAMAAAKASNNEVGLAANIAISSVYLDGVVPKQDSTFDHLLFSSKRTVPFSDEPRRRKQLEAIAKRQGKTSVSVSLFDYMGFAEEGELIAWESFKALPLPRWSINAKKERIKPGMANITVSIAEAGRKRDILEFANWYYSETKDKWSKLVKEAAKKALDVEDT